MTDEELAALGQPEGDYQEQAPDVTPPVDEGQEAEPVVDAPEDTLPADDGIPEQFRGKTAAQLAQIALDNKKYADRQAGELRKVAERLGLVKGEDGEYYPVQRQEEQPPKPQVIAPPTVDPELAKIEYSVANEKYNELLEVEGAKLAAKGELDADATNEQIHEFLQANYQSRYNALIARAQAYGKSQVQVLQTVANRQADARVSSLEQQVIPAEISRTVEQTVRAAGIVGLNDGDEVALAQEISQAIAPEQWRTASQEQRTWFINQAAKDKAYQNLVAKVQAMEQAPAEPEPPARDPEPVGTTAPRQAATVDARTKAEAHKLMQEIPKLSEEAALEIVAKQKRGK